MDPEVKTYRADLIRSAMAGQDPPWTNEVLAEKANLSQTTVSAIRNGSANVTLSSLRAVVDALGLRMEEIFQERAA